MSSDAVVTGRLVIVGFVSLLLLIGCGGSTNNRPTPTDPVVSVTISPGNVSNLP